MPVPHRPVSTLFAAIATAVCVLGPASTHARAAAALVEPTGETVIVEAREASKALRSLAAKFKLSGTSSFGDITPKANGTLRFARQDEPVEGRTWHTRVDGEYAPNGKTEPEPMAVLRTPEQLIYVDTDKKAVYERAQDDKRNAFQTALDMFGFKEMTNPEPFENELRGAEKWTYEGTETIDGTACDVVTVSYKPAVNKDGKPAAGISQSSKWYIGQDDRLPRRVDRITTGMISYTVTVELSDLKTNIQIDPASLAIETPEGYNRIVASGRANRAVRPTGPTTPRETTPDRETGEFDNALPAHGFELADADGNIVTLDSLEGSVAVLYFWGTWCVPCKNYSPLVSELVTTFEGQPVEVFGLAVRERSAENVRAAMEGYKHTLLLDPDGRPVGCDETARAYKVRRYPTVVVIGPDSKQLAFEFPQQGVSPEDMMAKIEQTIRTALDGME